MPAPASGHGMAMPTPSTNGSASAAVTVANVAPTVALQGSLDEASGRLTLQSLVTDPGILDTFTYRWQATKDGVVVATERTPDQADRMLSLMLDGLRART